MTYAELQQALEEFGLPEQVSLRQLRLRHRQLVQRYHPDTGADPDNDKIRRINAAYRVLNDYVARYAFDFSREMFYRQFPEERMQEQFYGVGLWGQKG